MQAGRQAHVHKDACKLTHRHATTRSRADSKQTHEHRYARSGMLTAEEYEMLGRLDGATETGILDWSLWNCYVTVTAMD